MNTMSTEHSPNDANRSSPEYLAQLLKDKKQIQAFPNVFVHLERLLDEEINKVRGNLFHFATNKEPLSLPEPVGPVVTLSEKLYVPVKEHPDFNFVGRILGPRGMTAKQLEQETGCKIMVRGKGSMRDKAKEEMNRGKPNWEHLNEELHVLITVEDQRNRGEAKLQRAVREVKKLLVPANEGEDDLKKRQLMELAILNGTYRDTKAGLSGAGATSVTQTSLAVSDLPRMIPAGMAPGLSPTVRSPQPTAGAPIILRHPGHAGLTPTSLASQVSHYHMAALQQMNGGPPPPLMSPDAAGGLLYPYDPYTLAATSTGAPLLEYPGLDQSAAGHHHQQQQQQQQMYEFMTNKGAVAKVRRADLGGAATAAALRAHPYGRVLPS